MLKNLNLNLLKSNHLSTKFLEYAFLERSIIPTNHFQKSLPRLPIPSLEATLSRYLKSQEALLTDSKFKETLSIVNVFKSSSISSQLQTLLQNYDNSQPNNSYISDMWFSYYLQDRKPLALNSNPFISIKDDPKPIYNEPVLRATNLIMSALRFKNSLDSNTLLPDIYHLKPHISETHFYRMICKMTPSLLSFYTSYLFGAFPLDMSQYKNIFCSARIPKLGRDSLYQESNDLPKLLVSVSGRLFLITLYDKKGAILHPTVIYNMLYYLYNSPNLLYFAPASSANDFSADTNAAAATASNAETFPNVGIMTAIADRNEWAAFRDDMISLYESNFDSLLKIDSAFFVLCLDKEVQHDQQPSIKNNESSASNLKPNDLTRAINLSRNFLLAPQNSKILNRWFDKSFQLIISPEGKVAVNMEHSWGDGVSVVRFLSDIFMDSVSRPALAPKEASGDALKYEHFIEPIDFKLDDSLKAKLEEKRCKMLELNRSLHLNVTFNSHINKSFLKSRGLSPDAIMQLAFQMANYKLTNQTSSTYESCSTAAFKKGRTETIRPATTDTKAFCQSFLSNSPSSMNSLPKEATFEMIAKCSKTHSKLTREAAMGQGWDRHLFALRQMAIQHNIELPAIFTDPSYLSINHNLLSTSTVDSPVIEMGGFGPVVTDGLGIGYKIDHEKAGIIVTGYENKTHDTSLKSKEFTQAAEESFEQLYKLIDQISPKKG